jgi:hypothetical protein
MELLAAVNAAPDATIANQWAAVNDGTLQNLLDELPEHHAHVTKQINQRILTLQRSQPA